MAQIIPSTKLPKAFAAPTLSAGTIAKPAKAITSIKPVLALQGMKNDSSIMPKTADSKGRPFQIRLRKKNNAFYSQGF